VIWAERVIACACTAGLLVAAVLVLTDGKGDRRAPAGQQEQAPEPREEEDRAA
jgi:hypothetical protein